MCIPIERNPSRSVDNFHQPSIKFNRLRVLNLQKILYVVENLSDQRTFETFSMISIGFKEVGGSEPHPRTLDRSLPVPMGKIQTSGIGWSKSIIRKLLRNANIEIYINFHLKYGI